MSAGGPLSERTLVLAPRGRDAKIAESILLDAGLKAAVCADLDDLVAQLERGAAVAVVVEEALLGQNLHGLSDWIADQPPWSDFPIVLLAQRGAGLERNPDVKRLTQTMGNVSFLERPFHPTTLVSMVRTALRGRLRQYEARERIEEIRRAEAELEARVEQRTAELASANRQLADQIAERERAEKALRQAQRLEAVGQLTSGVAHDFNNLLMVVLGNIRQLRKTAADPASQRRLDMMGEAAERGAKLTAQMLAFSRRQKLEPCVVDLNETVTRMHDLLESTMGGSTRIETRLSPRLWPAMIDPTQIELVILNLAINARDAMEVGGKLGVETANVTLGEPRRPEEPAAGDYVMVAVSDTGSGMSEAVLAKAFEPFFTTKPVGAGSGLGLSQVFGLAKQSGGGVRIDTEVGTGTTVSVYLPRAIAPAHFEGEASPPPPTRAEPGAVILLVDDDGAVREVTAGILAELGYQVIEAGSGPAALDLLDRCGRVDAAVLDFAMPGMNGAELAREIAGSHKKLPILFATGYADAGALVEAEDDHIVHKPFVDGELAEKLARALLASRLSEIA